MHTCNSAMLMMQSTSAVDEASTVVAPDGSGTQAGSDMKWEGRMRDDLKAPCDGILQRVITGKDRVPGVVAMITDPSSNIYEGAFGERMLGSGRPMTTDTVFAISRPPKRSLERR